MKKAFILMLSIACASLQIFGQGTAATWYFGKRVGVDFNTTPPTPLRNGNPSLEGCASISDGNGNLLFYTNGVTVYTSNHTQMQNGTFLAGNLSSTDNVVIVPKPGSTSLYYIFTVGDANVEPNGLNYSVVDIQQNGGLGSVIEKNSLIFLNTMEKLAAVRHCNKRDVWICVKEWGTDAYHTYLLTPSGVTGTPVVSNMGLVTNGNELNALGSLRFSSDGTKLAAAHSFDNDAVQLMRFNNQTGVLSDPVVFKANTAAPASSYPGTYGVAFSFNNQLLYISSRTSAAASSVLYQFDISSHNTAAIEASKFIVESNTQWMAGGLQQAINGKIYYSQWRSNALSVINNPDIPGAGCNFQTAGVNYAGNGIVEPLELGLPNFIASDLDSNYADYNFDWKITGGCDSKTIRFIPNNISDADSIKWDFGDGNVSDELSPEHTYAGLGPYTVTMRFYNQQCGLGLYISTNVVNISVLTISNFLPGDSSICEGNSIRIKPILTQSVDSLKWSTGATTDSITVSTPGYYWLDVYKGTCAFRDSILITQSLPISFDLGTDKQFCTNTPATFSVNTSVPATYLWNTGSTTSSIDVFTIGLYSVEVKSAQGCISRDSARAILGDCRHFVPSAFTPNGDGLNDTFGMLGGISTNIFKLQVFNRYGDIVFATKNPSDKWDGKVKGKPAPIGNYIWVMEFKNNEGFIQTDKGTVLLLH